MPRLIDLTPADTSSTVTPLLAASLREHHPRIVEMLTSQPPLHNEVSAAREKAEDADLVVVGTISAHMDPAQVELVEALLDTGTPTVTVALRTPWDLAVYPAAEHPSVHVRDPAADDEGVGRDAYSGPCPLQAVFRFQSTACTRAVTEPAREFARGPQRVGDQPRRSDRGRCHHRRGDDHRRGGERPEPTVSTSMPPVWLSPPV